MKKTLSLVLCVAMLMSSLSFCFPAFALEMEFGVESAENYAPTTDDLIAEAAQETTLAAVTPKAGDPGINIWTGTTAAFTFDGLTAENLGYAKEADDLRVNEKVRISERAMFKTESGNSYIDFNGKGWPHFAPLTNGVSVESDRPVKVSLEYRSAADTSVALVRNCDNMTTPVLASMSLTASTGWKSYSVTVKGTDAGATASNKGKPVSTHPGSWIDDTANIKNIVIIYTSSPAPDIDFDNVSAKPYYKVSFYKPDGTTLISSVYVDPDETTYNIPASMAEHGEFAVRGTTETVTSVTLANKDIDLVSKSVDYKAGMPGVNVFTGNLSAYGFEDPNYQHMYADTRRHGVQADPADANNTVMWLGPDQWSNMSLTPTPLTETNKFYPIQFEVVPENDRPITFSMRVKANKNNAAIYLYSGLDNNKVYNSNGWANLKVWGGLTTSYQTLSVDLTYSQLCRYGFPLLCVVNQHASSDDVSLYIDDLKLIPDYKVTFYAADGVTVIHSAYVDAAETTYTIPANVISKLDTEIYGGFAVKGASEIVTSVPLNHYDVDFVAQLKPGAIEWRAGMPGVNLWTGTPAPYNFESDDSTSFSTRFFPVGDASVVEHTVGGATTKAVKMTGGWPHFSTRLNVAPTVEKDRPILVSYDYIASASATIRLVRNTVNKVDPSLNDNNVSATTGWTSYTASIVGTSKAVTNADGGGGYKDDTQDIKNVWIMKPSNDTKVIYVDNVSFIPYYKVTYYDYDGTSVMDTEYVAPNAGSVTLPALDANLYKGYALKGTTGVVTSANLRYEDLEFVALLKDGVTVATPVSYTGNDNKTTDVDYRYPGVSYTFEEELDDTTLAGLSDVESISGWELSADKKVLTVYPYSRDVVPGETLTFAKTCVTSVKTASGKNVVLTEATLKFADSIDAHNLTPTGDMEGVYLPVSVISSQVADLAIVKETEGGNSYAALRYLGTEGKSNIYAYARTPIAFEEGASYKVYADIKILGGNPTPASVAAVWSNMIYAGADHAASAVASTSTGWVEFSREFTASGLTDSEEAVAFYSNPNGANVTEYAIDNLEVYKKAQVKFEANEFAPLKSGASAPTVEGKYPYVKGGTKNPDAKVTLPTASDYYEVTDARRTISGWLGSDGVVYADGAEIDLAETGSITFQPNLVAAPGYKFITVKFEGDLAEAPAAVAGALEGDTINLKNYYSVAASEEAKAAGKRFNGWSLTGEAKDIIDTLEITNSLANAEDEIIVKAVVNYDWNFAIPGNQTGWRFYNGEGLFENDMLVGYHVDKGSHDTYFNNNHLSVPGGRIQSIIYVLDEDIKYIDRKDHSQATITDMKIVATSNARQEGVQDASGNKYPLVEVIYYGQGHGRNASYTLTNITVSDLTDGFKAVTATVYDTAAKKFVTSQPFDLTKKLTTADFDTQTTVNNAGVARLYSNVGLRYIHFADYPKYDTKTVAITNFEAPETGKKPDTAATAAAGTVKSIEWTNLSESGSFKENTTYEVTVKLEPEAGKRYADDTVFTLEGATATSTVINNDSTGEAFVTFKFNAATLPYKTFEFDLSTLTDIEVTSIDPIQLNVNVTDADADVDTSIVWSITDGTDVAEVTEDGLLTVFKAGTITLKAISVYNENKSAEKTINITLGAGLTSTQITFAGDLAEVPAAITRLAGSTIDITKFYDVTASATAASANKRFNGWSTTGAYDGLIITNEWTVPAENTTLTAIVNYDVNFAIPANTSKAQHSRGSVSFDAEKGMVFADHRAGQTNGRATDFFITFVANAPVAQFKGYEAYLLNEFTAYADNDKNGATTKKFTEQTETSHFYFKNTSGYPHIQLKATAVTGADGVEYAKFTAIASGHEAWNGSTNYMRLDPFDTIVTSAYVRYFRYIPYDIYEGDLAVSFDAPATGIAPATATVNEIGALKSFTLTPEVPAESGLYEGAKVYTATAVIEPADKVNYKFRDGVKVTIGGIESTDVVVAADGTVTATVTFPATSDYVDFDVVVDSDALDGNTLVTDGTPVQFTAEFTGDAVTTEEVVWSVDNTAVATVDENGLLTPYTAGTVTVSAKSKYNLNKIGEKEITVEIEEGKTSVQISFAGDLAEVPATITRISGTIIDIRDYYNVTATTAGLRFNGWSTTGELADLITTNEWIVPEEDTTLTAIVNYDFNMAIPANNEAWKSSHGTKSVERDYERGVVTATASAGDWGITAYDWIPAHVASSVEIYADITDLLWSGSPQTVSVGTQLLQTFFWKTDNYGLGNANSSVHYGKADEIIDGTWAKICVPVRSLSGWTDDQTVKQIRIDPWTQAADSRFSVRYIRFVGFEEIEGDIEIEAPVPTTGETVSDSVTVNEICEVTNVAISPDDFITYTSNGNEIKAYKAGNAYTVTYTVKTADGAACFTDGVTATVNGNDAQVVLSTNKTVATVTYTFPATEAYTPIAVSISGPSEILTKGRASQYRATITAPDGSAVVVPTTSVTWSLASGDESYATVNAETGKLVPIRNAHEGLTKEYVTIIATSNYDGTTVATYNVQLKNQGSDAVINYVLNGGVPTAGGTTLDPTVGAGTIQLAGTDTVKKDGYAFIGWATSDETAETVTSLALTAEDDQDTSTADIIDYTVYAVWQKVAFGWEFNSQAEVDSFPAMNAAHHTKRFVPEEGSVELTTIVAADTYQYVSGLSIDTSKTKTLSFRIKPDGADNVVFYFVGNSVVGDLEAQGKISVFAAQGAYAIKKLTAGAWNEVTFDLSGYSLWDGTVTKIRYDLFDNNALSTSLIDYIRFLEDYVDVVYDANAGSDTVTELPENGLVKFGEKLVLTDAPVRDGYIFVGWSKTADGSTGVKKDFAMLDNTTLYAIWEASNTTVEADGSIVVGAINPAADEVLLVKTDAGATVTLFGDDGAPLMTATAGSDGYAEFDLTTLSAPVTNASVATEAGNTLESATVTDEATADIITAVPETDTGSTGGADDDDDKPSSTPSTKVETVTKPGEIDPSTMYPEEEVEEEEGEEEFQFNGYAVVNTDELPYVDVNTGNWFYKEVESAYKLGFVKGKSVFTYDPNGNVTIAEAITFALRLNYGYYGKEMPEIATEGDWYTPIVEAALEAGIIKKAQFTEYDVPALRKQVAAIMAKSVPSDYLGTKNMFTSIPDVNKKAPEFTAILKLYRAGVVIGSDDKFNFMPETHITRAEMAAIINRIAIPENRKRIVTAEELEARRKEFSAEDIVANATAGNCYADKLTLKGGYAVATGKSADPIIYLTNLVPELDGANTGNIRIGLKTDAKPAPQLFFTVPGGGWAADRMLSGTKGADKGNGVVEYVFDTKSNTQFANTITGLRFDPFNAKDIEFAIAYVIFE